MAADSPRTDAVWTRRYFFFFESFPFPFLPFCFSDLPGGTQPQPQFSFLANLLTSFHFSLWFLPVAHAGNRRCTALRSHGGGGIPENVSPPS